MGKKGGRKRILFGKKAQEVFGMSFGMIFSILLIIFFIAIAFIVIKQFLGMQDCVLVGIFVDKLKSDAEKTWYSESGTHVFSGELPSKIEKICFANLSENFAGKNMDVYENIKVYEGSAENVFFYPIKKSCDMPKHRIKPLALDTITKNENPYCVDVKKGKVEIKIEKKIGDRYVILGRV